MSPRSDEQEAVTGRPRAILAALCLADEPNVDDTVAGRCLDRLVESVGSIDGGGHVDTELDAAAVALARSQWREDLCRRLALAYSTADVDRRFALGGLLGMVSAEGSPDGTTESQWAAWVGDRVEELTSPDEEASSRAALVILDVAYRGMIPTDIIAVSGRPLASALMGLLERDASVAFAGSWALAWFDKLAEERGAPVLGSRDVREVARRYGSDDTPSECVRFLGWILEQHRFRGARRHFVRRVEDPDDHIRSVAMAGLGAVGGESAVPILARALEADGETRSAAMPH